MNALFLVPVVAVVASLVYVVIINKRRQAAATDIHIDQERQQYALHKQELLNQDFSFLHEWMNGKPIDAFSSASIPQSTASKVQTFIGDGLKRVALSGIGIKMYRVETVAYWVLSGKELHFLTTDTEGDLEEHLIFNQSRIEKARLAAPAKQAAEQLSRVHIITFNVDGAQLAFEIHDRLKYIAHATDMWNMKKQLLTMTQYQVVGERLVPELQSRFPNLAIA